MTDYLNNPNLLVADKYIQDAAWYKDKVFNTFGRFEYPVKFNDQTKVQLNKVIAVAANIRKGIEKEYPNASKSQIKSLLVTPFWFSGLISLTNAQWEDMEAGNPRVAAALKAQIDAVEYQFNEDRRTWFTDGPTSGTDVNYSAEWIPFFNLTSTANSSIGDPADMNGKAGGTAGTLLDLTGVIAYSASTNATIDFAQALLGDIFTAFEAFVDSNNGRRMVDLNGSESGIAGYTMYIALPLIRRLKMTHPYDGEKFLMNENLYDQITALGVDIVALPGMTYSFAEDGEVYFNLCANVTNNFKAGVCKAMTWTPWTPTNNTLKPDHERGMDTRLLAAMTPYYDGTNFFKAMVKGKFTWMNDAE